MKIESRRAIVFGAFLIATVSYASAVVPFGKALEQRQIALTKESLVAALRNPDPEIRKLAAFKLLWEDHAFDTIPLVESALRVCSFSWEKEPLR